MASTKIPSSVERIVGRCHVGDSDRRIIRYFISRLKKGYKTWAAAPVAERKQYLRWIIQAHRENQSLYRSVMTGRF
jgi:acyl-CoA reductase-like NAD-dependent aldehyde dehydrogenase